MCNPTKEIEVKNVTINIDRRRQTVANLNEHHALVMDTIAELKKGAGSIHRTMVDMVLEKLGTMKKLDVVKLGKHLMGLGADNFCNGGFWIIDIATGIEYYSDKFITSLGFTDHNDFPYTVESWQKQIDPEGLEVAVENFTKHLDTKGAHPYYQIVDYNKKDGGRLKTVCNGTAVFQDEEPLLMLGTHRNAEV